MNERPDDCPDQSGNGGGCFTLQQALQEQARHSERLKYQETRIGQLKVSVDASKDASDRAESSATRAESAANRAADSADAIRRVICGPANDALAQHQSDSRELLDAADDHSIDTSVSIRVPHLAERRIRHEERLRIEAEKRAEELGAERERVKLAAKLEAERVATAAKIKQEQDDREKRNARLLHSALALGLAITTAVTTYLASRGH